MYAGCRGGGSDDGSRSMMRSDSVAVVRSIGLGSVCVSVSLSRGNALNYPVQEIAGDRLGK
jgi:hypothetical protein